MIDGLFRGHLHPPLACSEAPCSASADDSCPPGPNTPWRSFPWAHNGPLGPPLVVGLTHTARRHRLNTHGASEAAVPSFGDRMLRHKA